MSDSARILVTGGTGFVGAHVVAALVEQGESVRVHSRTPLDPPPVQARCEYEAGDLRDAACRERLLRGVGSMVHLAASGLRGGEDAGELWATNVEATRSLAREARQAGVRRFVHVSSAGVYGDSGRAPLNESSPVAPLTGYQRTKLESERALKDELGDGPTAWAILRPYGIYGPGRRQSAEFLREVQHRRVWFYGPVSVTLHPTYVGDVVQAVLQSLDRAELPAVRGEVFNVGGERPVEHFEFVRLVAARLGARVSRVGLPASLAPACLALGRLGLPGAARLGQSVVYAVDTSKARAVLGVEPESLDRGIAATIEWARRTGAL